MFFRIRIVLWLMLLYCVNIAKAQVDSVYELSPAMVEVRAERSIRNIDTLNGLVQTASLSSILSQNSTLFVKPYGANTLSSLSIRGGQPEQSTIFWNGISLQNNTNGVVDLNLLPGLFFDGATLNNLQSTSRGSGSISGSLNVYNNTIFNDSTKSVGVVMGQFGLIGVLSTLGYGTKKVWNQTRIIANQSQNNYPYHSLTYPLDKKVEILTNAASSQIGVLHQMHLNFKEKRPVHLRAWLQTNNREIPATMLEAPQTKSQQDNAVRLQGDWSTRLLAGDLSINGAWFKEDLIYRDYDTFDYRSNTSTLLFHYTRSIKPNHFLGVDIEGRNFNVLADTFYNQIRNELSAAVHNSITWRLWTINIGLRLAYYSAFSSSPILYSFELKRPIKKGWQAGFKGNSNYRIPTFNNLYWRPGGNASLLPERSQNQTIEFAKSSSRMQFIFTGFSSLITNQIQWLPTSKGYFEATQVVNQNRWNRGLEAEIKVNWKSLKSQTSFQFTRSSVINNSFQTSTKQQVFIPKFQSNQTLFYHRKNWALSFSAHFIGTRFTDVENKNSLSSIFLTDIKVSRKLKSLMLTCSVENLLNKSYQVMPYRPMPPRTFMLGMQWNFNSSNKD